MQLLRLGWQWPSPSAWKAGSAMKNMAVSPFFTPMKAMIGSFPSGSTSSSLMPLYVLMCLRRPKRASAV